MRSNKEMAEEVLRRVEVINRRKAVKKRKIYSALAAVACLALMGGLSFAISSIETAPIAPGAEGMYSAVMFADGGLGGYVLIGVIGLALGAALMFFYMRKSGKD